MSVEWTKKADRTLHMMYPRNTMQKIAEHLTKEGFEVTVLQVQTRIRSRGLASAKDKPGYLSTAEAIEYLGVPVGTFKRHIRKGLISGEIFGRNLFFTWDAVIAYEEEHIKAKEDALDNYYTVPEVVKILGYARSWVYELTTDGRLQSIVVNGRRLILKKDVLERRNQIKMNPRKINLEWKVKGGMK